MGNVCTTSSALPIDTSSLPHAYPGSNGNRNDTSTINGTVPRRNPNGSMIISTGNGGGGNGGGISSSSTSSLSNDRTSGGGSMIIAQHHKDDNHSTSVAEKLANLGFSGIKRNNSGNNIKSSSSSSSTVSLISLQSGHTVDLRSLPELPPALFLAAIFNDVAFFKAIPIVEKATILAARKAHLNLLQQYNTNTNTQPSASISSTTPSSSVSVTTTTKPLIETTTNTTTTTTGTSTTNTVTAETSTSATTTLPSSATAAMTTMTNPTNSSTNDGNTPTPTTISGTATGESSSSLSTSTSHTTSGLRINTVHNNHSNNKAFEEQNVSSNSSAASSSLLASSSAHPIPNGLPKRTLTSTNVPVSPSTTSPSAGPTLADLVNACDKHGDTIVQLAAAAGSKDVLEILLTIYPRALKQLKPGNHNSLLHYATLGPVHVAEYIKAVKAHVLHNPDLCTNSLEESAAAVAISDGLALVDGHPSATTDSHNHHHSPPIIISNGNTTTINADGHHHHSGSGSNSGNSSGSVTRSNSGSMLSQMGLGTNTHHPLPSLASGMHLNHAVTVANLSSSSSTSNLSHNNGISTGLVSPGNGSTNNVHVVLHGNHTSISDLAIERPGLTHGAGTYLASQGISIPSLIPGLPSYPHPEPMHSLSVSHHHHNNNNNNGSIIMNRNNSVTGLSSTVMPPHHTTGPITSHNSRVSPNPSGSNNNHHPTAAASNLPPLHRTPSAFITNIPNGTGISSSNPNGSGILLHRSDSTGKEPLTNHNNNNIVHPGAVTRSTSAYMQHHVDDPLYITGFAYLKALMAYTRRWENSHDVLSVIGDMRINSGSSSPTSSNNNENIGADFLDGTGSPRDTNQHHHHPPSTSAFGTLSARLLNRTTSTNGSSVTATNNSKNITTMNNNSLINSHHNHPSSGNLSSGGESLEEGRNSPLRTTTGSSSSSSITASALGKALAREADIRDIGIVTVDHAAHHGNNPTPTANSNTIVSSSSSTHSHPSSNGRSSPDSHYHYHFHQPYTTRHTDAECHGYELGVLDIGHGEEGVIPYLDPSFRIKDDVNTYPVRTRFPSRRTDLTVELLLAHGVIYNVKNSYLKTPWDTAYMHSQQVLPEAGVMSTGATGNCISGDILRDPPWNILFDPQPVSWDNVCAALQDAATNTTLNPNLHHSHPHGPTMVHGHSSLAIASARNTVLSIGSTHKGSNSTSSSGTITTGSTTEGTTHPNTVSNAVVLSTNTGNDNGISVVATVNTVPVTVPVVVNTGTETTTVNE